MEISQLELNSSLSKNMSGKSLRKTVSDVTSEINNLGKELGTIFELDEQILQAAECECCGLKEVCTKEYITNIRNSHSGEWVCGLCSEAVKERLKHEPITAIEEAIISHRNFCQEFNTTRLNPKLSLTCALKDIAKKCCEKRRNNLSSAKRIIRSSSCVPRIDLNMK